MIIDCPDCYKKFDIDRNLIPLEGRLLQCGSCNHKWFFKLDITAPKKNDEIKSKKKLIPKSITEPEEKPLIKETETEVEKISIVKKKKQANINYLNILLVVIISIIAFILIVDTFENNLKSIIPNIDVFLNNLYLSIEDIKLFMLDLFK